MKAYFKRLLPDQSILGWVVRTVYQRPFTCLIIIIRSLIATRKLTGTFYPVRVRISAGQKIAISKNKSARVNILGVVTVSSWNGNFQPSSISLAEESCLLIGGDFEIGPNVHISLSKNSTLTVGGKLKSSGSGITCNSRIMVENSVSIGTDCIIAWDVFITDSDWHEIEGRTRTSPVVVGQHVWVSHGVSLLKGSEVADGSIIGAKSLVSGRLGTPNSLYAGNPAKLIKTDIRWKR